MSSWKKHVSEHSKVDIMKQVNSLPLDLKYRTEDRLHIEFHRQKHTHLSKYGHSYSYSYKFCNKSKEIGNEKELQEFMVSEGIEDYSKIPVEKVKFSNE